MYARAINARALLVATAIATLLLVGAGVAYATSSGDDEDASEQRATGRGVEKAERVALDHTNGGRVTGTEVGDEEGFYEVEVTRDDGGRVDVHLTRDFDVLGTRHDHEAPDGEDAPDD